MEKADVWRSGTERSYLSTSDWQVIYINALPNLTFSFPRSFFLSVLFLISGKTPKGIISPQLTPLEFFFRMMLMTTTMTESKSFCR